MAPPIAYGLRAEYDGTVDRQAADGSTETVPVFTGGLIAVDGADFDVRAELDAGNGVITVDDTNGALMRALDEYPALKRVEAPADAKPVTTAERLSTRDLRDALRGRGLPTGGNRDELEARLTNAEHGVTVEPVDTGDAGRAGEPGAGAENTLNTQAGPEAGASDTAATTGAEG